MNRPMLTHVVPTDPADLSRIFDQWIRNGLRPITLFAAEVRGSTGSLETVIGVLPAADYQQSMN